MSTVHRFAASRRAAVAPFHTMTVFEAATLLQAAGREVFDLSVGQPSTPAPGAVRRAAHAALDAEGIGYTGALGIPSLRTAVARHYLDWYGLEIDPASVAMTTGSSGGFIAAFLAAFDVGDTVAVTTPGYPAYRNVLAALGCDVLELRCEAATGFRPTIAMLEDLPRPPAGLVLASPANPTGAMVGAAELEQLVGWCAEHRVRLISDEIYHGLTYTTRGACAWQYGREPVVVNSFSKYFSMTGWRLGWLLLPDDLVDPVAGLLGNLALCPPTLSQHAALGAFESYAELDANVERYAANRRFLLDALPGAGLSDLSAADGAFYLYADVSHHTTDSLRWVHEVLRSTGVALAPGVDFDAERGGRAVRISFAGDIATLTGAVERLGAYLLG